MLRYLNNSRVTKTFYGVTFKPNEIHDVPGYINHPKFIRVPDLPKEPPKAVSIKKTEKPKAPNKPTIKENPESIITQGGNPDGSDSNQ